MLRFGQFQKSHLLKIKIKTLSKENRSKECENVSAFVYEERKTKMK